MDRKAEGRKPRRRPRRPAADRAPRPVAIRSRRSSSASGSDAGTACAGDAPDSAARRGDPARSGRLPAMSSAPRASALERPTSRPGSRSWVWSPWSARTAKASRRGISSSTVAPRPPPGHAHPRSDPRAHLLGPLRPADQRFVPQVVPQAPALERRAAVREVLASARTSGRCSSPSCRSRPSTATRSGSHSPASSRSRTGFSTSPSTGSRAAGGPRPRSPTARGARARLLDRYADSLAELLERRSAGTPRRPAIRTPRPRRGARVTRRAPLVARRARGRARRPAARARRRHRPGHRPRGRRDRPHARHGHASTPSSRRAPRPRDDDVTARNRTGRRRHAGSGSTTRSSPSCPRDQRPRSAGQGRAGEGPEAHEGRRAAADRLREPAVQRQEPRLHGHVRPRRQGDARRPRDPRRPEPRDAARCGPTRPTARRAARSPSASRRASRSRSRTGRSPGPRPTPDGGTELATRHARQAARLLRLRLGPAPGDLRGDAARRPGRRRDDRPARSAPGPTTPPGRARSATCSPAACRSCATRSACRGRTPSRSPSRRPRAASAGGYAGPVRSGRQPDRGRLLGRHARRRPRGRPRLVQRLARSRTAGPTRGSRRCTRSGPRRRSRRRRRARCSRTTLKKAAIPLNAWARATPAPTATPERDGYAPPSAYGYAASLALAEAIAERAGDDTLKAVWAAAAARSGRTSPSPPADAVATRRSRSCSTGRPTGARSSTCSRTRPARTSPTCGASGSSGPEEAALLDARAAGAGRRTRGRSPRGRVGAAARRSATRSGPGSSTRRSG